MIRTITQSPIFTSFYTSTTPSASTIWYDDRVYIPSPSATTTSTSVWWKDYPPLQVTTGTASTAIYITADSCPSRFVYYPRMDEPDRLRSQREYTRRRSAQVQTAKSAIKRALKLMDNVGFGNDVRVFLGGDTVEVCHPDSMFKFLLSKHRNNLIERTIHPGVATPYKLELYTKTDVHVANLCVYMVDTPILDQILALSMFIKSGDENHILETANWSCIIDDPVLLQSIALQAPSLSRKLLH